MLQEVGTETGDRPRLFIGEYFYLHFVLRERGSLADRVKRGSRFIRFLRISIRGRRPRTVDAEPVKKSLFAGMIE